MKNFLKQFGKVLCYYFLFLGMQVAVSVAFIVGYTVKAAMEMATSGAALDADAVALGATEYVMQSINEISIISGCLTILALWIFFLIRKKKLQVETNVTKVSVKYVPIIMGLGVFLAAMVSFGLSLLPESMLAAYAQQSEMVIGSSTVVMVISNMIVAPIVEEIIFRGLIFTRLRKALPVVWAVVLSSLLFGIAHGQIVWIIYAFGLGVILSVVVVKTESLAASILLHMMFNIFGTVIPTVFASVTSTVVCGIVALVAAVISAALLVVLLRGKESKNDALEAA